MRAWDMSNYLTPSANTDPDGFRRFVERSRDEMDCRLFLVQGIDPPARYPRSQTKAQAEIVLDTEGVSLGGYVYPFYGNGPDDCKGRLETLEPYRDRMVCLALDLEDTTSGLPFIDKAEMTDAWLVDCDAFSLVMPEPQTGIYTGEGVWDGIGFPRTYSHWADRWLWWASYLGPAYNIMAEPSIESSFRLVTRGGFTKLVLRQYLGSRSQFAGYSGFDANVVLDSWLEEITAMPLPDVGDDYWSKFGPSGNNTLANRQDWPSVARNLEGIISTVQAQTGQPDLECAQALQSVKDVLKVHGYLP